MAAEELQLPPGFRFHPTDEELVMHYLCRKCASQPISVPIIAEIDLYKFDPWDLPGVALYGEKEWYFFSPRDRKYPNGSRPNRAAGTGYWKATGADKPIGRPKPVAIKKALVFYAGKAPKGVKTNWIMHEYRLADVDRSARNKNNSLRLDDWVLCRIYNKKGVIEKRNSISKQPVQNQQTTSMAFDYEEDKKPTIFPPATQASMSHTTTCNDYRHFDTMSDSIPPPRLHADSTTSCSGHVVSPSEVTCDKEVQSEPKWRGLDMDLKKTIDVPYNYMEASLDFNPFGAATNQMSPLQDIFLYMQNPF